MVTGTAPAIPDDSIYKPLSDESKEEVRSLFDTSILPLIFDNTESTQTDRLNNIKQVILLSPNTSDNITYHKAARVDRDGHYTIHSITNSQKDKSESQQIMSTTSVSVTSLYENGKSTDVMIPEQQPISNKAQTWYASFAAAAVKDVSGVGERRLYQKVLDFFRQLIHSGDSINLSLTQLKADWETHGNRNKIAKDIPFRVTPEIFAYPKKFGDALFPPELYAAYKVVEEKEATLSVEPYTSLTLTRQLQLQDPKTKQVAKLTIEMKIDADGAVEVKASCTKPNPELAPASQSSESKKSIRDREMETLE